MTGKAFETESMLRDRMAKVLFREERGAIAVRPEMQIGAIIPDLVAVHLPPYRATMSRPLTFKQAHVLASLRSRPRHRIETLAARCHMRVDSVKGVLEALMRTGLVQYNASGSVSVVGDSQGAEVLAIEAKLRRWSDAVEQALRYRTFADRVGIALDAAYKLPERAVSMCTKEGVGVWLVSRTSVTAVVEPRIRCVRTPEREYVIASAMAGQTPWMRAWS